VSEHRLQRRLLIDGKQIGWMIPSCTCGWEGEKVSREEGFDRVVAQEQKHLEESKHEQT